MPSSKLLYPSFAMVLLTLCGAEPRSGPVARVAPRDHRVRADPDPSWMAVVSDRIRDGGYRFFPGAGGFRAEVAERGLTARFDDAGAQINGAGHEGDHPVTVRSARVGRPGRVEGIASVAPGLGECQEGKVDPVGACIPRLEYATGGVTEWWEAGPNGLEQGWVVAERPPGDGPLWIDVEVANADVVVQGAQVRLVGDAGDALVVRGLLGQDARGEDVPLRFQGTDDGFRVVVDDEGAEYPIVVDPVYTSEDWSVYGVGGEALGNTVAGAGDTNGDGYDDVLVGSSSATYLFEGSASGVGTSAVMTLAGATKAGAAGDVNGDGYGDVLVGGDLYLGSAEGLSETASISLEGDVVPAGDVDGDGYDDVAVGLVDSHNYYSADVYLGSAAGLVGAVAWSLCSESTAYYGLDYFSLSGAGDVNGDGASDVLFGITYFDSYYDSTTGERVSRYYGDAIVFTGPTESTFFGVAGENTGAAVSGAGDVDGDGYGDVLVGATLKSYEDGWAGEVYLVRGSADGLDTTAITTLVGDSASPIGSELAPAGDVNGDGFSDVLVGGDLYMGSSEGLGSVPAATFDGMYAGAGDTNGDGFDDVVAGDSATALELGYGTGGGGAWVYLGSAEGLAGPSTVLVEPGEHLGTSIAAIDVNRDGYEDVIVGAFGYDGSRGEALVYAGSPTGLAVTPAVTLLGSQVGDFFGGELAPAGDTNGDGYEDVIIGAPGAGGYGEAYVYAGSGVGMSGAPAATLLGDATAVSFGYPVAGIGDANGDGYDDVAVGAFTGPDYLWTFDGSGSGTSPTASTGVSLGCAPTAIASAGDVNDDGYGDMVVGCEDDAEAGAAFVYLGSTFGTTDAGATTLEGEDEGDRFGHAVSGVGDVDGDGYDDVAVGAPDHDSLRGRVYVYAGSVGGSSPTALDVVDGSSASPTPSYLGTWVSGVGDLDGDGFDDLALAAPGDEAVFVYPGGGSGLGSSPVLSATGLDALEDAVAWGDFNGDGLLDLARGDSSYGASGGRAGAWYGCVDADLDGRCVAVDCDDADPAVQDLYFADRDGDGYGDPDSPSDSCVPRDGYVEDQSDCDDSRASVNPGQDEICNDIDDDCDGSSDQDSVDASSWSPDHDLDGYGAADVQFWGCSPSPSYVHEHSDCNDLTALVNPAADEVCNRIDDDCDGGVDEGGALDALTWYPDADADGYTGPGDPVASCDEPEGYSEAAEDDCDDTDPDVYPGAGDPPGDGIDQNCNGRDTPGQPCGCGATPAGASAAFTLLGALLARRRRSTATAR